MIMKLYSIKDKLMEFTGPIAFKDDKIAKRTFEAFRNQKKTAEYTDPKYWDLYCIGEFDSETGVVKGYKQSQLKLIMEGEQHEPENEGR